MSFNLDFKSTFYSTMISKNIFCIFSNQSWFQGDLNFSQVNNIHNVSIVSSEEGVNIIISKDSPELCQKRPQELRKHTNVSVKRRTFFISERYNSLQFSEQ